MGKQVKLIPMHGAVYHLTLYYFILQCNVISCVHRVRSKDWNLLFFFVNKIAFFSSNLSEAGCLMFRCGLGQEVGENVRTMNKCIWKYLILFRALRVLPFLQYFLFVHVFEAVEVEPFT